MMMTMTLGMFATTVHPLPTKLKLIGMETVLVIYVTIVQRILKSLSQVNVVAVWLIQLLN